MRLVEQHRRHAGEFRIAQDRRHEDRLGHHHDPRSGRALAVEPGQVADRLANRFAPFLGHAFGRGARCNAPGAEQDHTAAAPWLGQQRGCDSGGLARARRRHKHSIRTIAQRGKQCGQRIMDRKRAHPPAPTPAGQSAQRPARARARGANAGRSNAARTPPPRSRNPPPRRPRSCPRDNACPRSGSPAALRN